MQKDKILSYLGLATRAGRTVSGAFCVEKSVKQHRAKLVIVSEEASENSRKKFRNICTSCKVPLYIYGDSRELGAACGKEFRMCAAVEDEGLANAAIRQLEQRSETEGGKNVR